MFAAGPRLGVIDRMHLELDREAARLGADPATCAVVAVLEGRADERALERRLVEVSPRIPELGWSLGRDRWLQPAWKVGRPRAELEVVGVEGDWAEVTEQRLPLALGPEEPWRLELWRGPEGDAVALRWLHPLDDAHGATRLLRCLAGEAPVGEARFAAPEARLIRFDRRQRLAMTRAYGDHALALAREGAILSPRRAASEGAPGRRRFLRWRFSAEETRAFVASLRARARLADTSLFLFATTRLYRAILRARGVGTGRYVVPIPLALDPKKGCERLFGNNVTMMMLALDDEQLDDEAAAVASLAAQQRAIVRDKLDLAMIASLDSLRFVPDRASQWLAKSPFGGQRSSFVLSNPGPLALDRIADRPVVDAFAAVTAAVDPGLVVVSQRFGDRMSVTLSWWEGFLSEDEIVAQEFSFRADLLGQSSGPSSAMGRSDSDPSDG